MKEVKHYVCDICGTMYSSPTIAEKCEQYHVKPKKISKEWNKEWYKAVTENTSPFYKYPKKIKIEMFDGSIQLYAHTDK